MEPLTKAELEAENAKLRHDYGQNRCEISILQTANSTLRDIVNDLEAAIAALRTKLDTIHNITNM